MPLNTLSQVENCIQSTMALLQQQYIEKYSLGLLFLRVWMHDAAADESTGSLDKNKNNTFILYNYFLWRYNWLFVRYTW